MNPAAPRAETPAGPIASLCFFRFTGLADKAWAFSRMATARGPLARLPGVGFVKLMGAGTGEGFTPVPDTGVVAILSIWPDLETAVARTERSDVFRRYLDRATERFALHLAPIAARGAWSGRQPFEVGPDAGDGPVAALTRASVRPRHALKFWRRVPRISERVGRDANVLFKAGVGEVPWLHQVTFSVWPDLRTMAEFARVGGPHADAIKAVRDEGWFAEELYARFRLRAHAGTWGGRDPFARLVPAIAAE
jgi:spheroidene monooxygenase